MEGWHLLCLLSGFALIFCAHTLFLTGVKS